MIDNYEGLTNNTKITDDKNDHINIIIQLFFINTKWCTITICFKFHDMDID